MQANHSMHDVPPSSASGNHSTEYGAARSLSNAASDQANVTRVQSCTSGPSFHTRTQIIKVQGRLPEQEIDHMVAEAEKRKVEDEAEAERLVAKNGLEAYAYGLKREVCDDITMTSKMSSEDQSAFRTAVDNAASFLDGSGDASTEEIKKHHDDLKNVADPILRRLDADKGAIDAAGGMPRGAAGDVANKL